MSFQAGYASSNYSKTMASENNALKRCTKGAGHLDFICDLSLYLVASDVVTLNLTHNLKLRECPK